MKLILFLLWFCVCSFSGTSQNIDSLYAVAKQTKNDSIKLRLYNKVGFGYIFNDPEKAKKVLVEGLRLAKDSNLDFSLTELTNTYGIYFHIKGESDSARYYFENAHKLSRDFEYKDLEAKCINNLGMFNWQTSDFEKALGYFFQSLKMNEALDDEQSTSYALNNIGLIYQEMNLNEKALEYHKKSLLIREKYDLKNDQIASLNNIGINQKQLGRIEEAITTYKKGIDLAKAQNNLSEYYKLLFNLANTYNLSGNLKLALETYLKCLDKPDDYDAEEQFQLHAYNSIASVYNEMDQPKLALTYTAKGFELLKKYPEAELQTAVLYLTTAESYYMLNDFKNARLNKEKFIILKDSIFSEANAKAMADLEVTYETEKKEREILIQRAELAENRLTIQQRNYQIFGLIGLALILVVMGYLLYKQQELKTNQLQKESALKDALLKIETQSRLQEQRLRISRDLHDNIGAQLTFIISSIDNLKYGFDISDQKLTRKLESISTFTSSTIYELRDTIWAMNKTEISIEDLQARISNFIEKADLASDGVDFSFRSNASEIGDLKFSSVEGMNIYRIIQESINNALKYSEATKIAVNFSTEGHQLVFDILDNGQGFDLSTVQRGNGIANMNKRAQDIGAHLDIASEEKKGTTITLRMNTTNDV
ncbi:tetratricopeptide repeat-containing sensor histidine kinase [Psychroserpens sp.]|uniref:tetratricopeptide repeat-containing sensor histidine kinase n=1 Tax=Psychroserpens sp. TaxID=2020870 RepID=UPI003C77241C